MSTAVPTIIVRYNDPGRQWEARLDGPSCVTYTAALPSPAVHRLLLEYGTPAGNLLVRIDRDQTGLPPLFQEAVWKPPELLFKCERCNGTGEYVGLLEREKCGPCKGRGWLPS